MENRLGRPANILLVEDNPDDQLITRRAIENGTGMCHVFIANDGKEALDFLYHQEGHDEQNSPRPDLILLDLNMPRVDGREFLSRLRADSQMRDIPVVVLTTSRHEEDVARSYSLGCNSFIQKPVGREELRRVVEMIQNYWFKLVELPPQPANRS